MGRSLVRGILNSARGISDKDMSAEAQATRRISGFADLDGIEFIARIDIGTDTNGDDKNEVRSAVTPDHRDYAQVMGRRPRCVVRQHRWNAAAQVPAPAPQPRHRQPRDPGLRASQHGLSEGDGHAPSPPPENLCRAQPCCALPPTATRSASRPPVLARRSCSRRSLRSIEDSDAKACVLAHRDELTAQNRDKFGRVNPELTTSVIDAKSKIWAGQATFAMVPTLARPGNLAAMPALDLLVIDEAHHAVADSYRRIIDRVRDANPDARIFGVTATPNRGDSKGLREVFDNVADQVRLGELIASGHLVPPRTFVIDVGVQDEAALGAQDHADFDMTRWRRSWTARRSPTR